MKKLCFFSFVLFATIAGEAQSLEEIGKMMDKAQYTTAKSAIDKYLAEPKNAASAEAWYYKGRIYNSLSRDSSVAKQDAYNYKIAAFEALKKNQQLDKLDIRMKSEFFKSYLDIYLGFYDLGAQNFNLKDFNAAYNAFSKSQDIENFILSKNYTYEELKLQKFDTALVMNIAASALQGGDTTNAVLNYRRITDGGITGPDYERVYEYLASYYLGKADDINAQAMLAKGKAAYPSNEYWNAIELEQIGKTGDKKALLARYEELYVANPLNFQNSFNYSVELYNGLWADDNKTIDTTVFSKLITVLKSAIEADKGVDAMMLLNNHLFNIGADYSTKAALVKGTKPEDVKKKKDLNASMIKYMDESIPYGEKLITHFTDEPKLTNKQKISYKQVANSLSEVYRLKGNSKKTAEYDAISDSIKF
ncbi:MAG: hypothetical protein ACKVOM_04235 [Ferruginibacter sp.]